MCFCCFFLKETTRLRRDSRAEHTTHIHYVHCTHGTDGQMAKLGQTNEINLRGFFYFARVFGHHEHRNRFIFVCLFVFIYFLPPSSSSFIHAYMFCSCGFQRDPCVDEAKSKHKFRVSFITPLQSCFDPIYVMRLTACSTITAYIPTNLSIWFGFCVQLLDLCCVCATADERVEISLQYILISLNQSHTDRECIWLCASDLIEIPLHCFVH